MKHLSETELALHAGGDLDFWSRLQTKLHISRCLYCAREVERYSQASSELHQAARVLPASLRWDRLAEEITANVRVGLEAGECVSPGNVGPDRFGWQTVAAAACLSGVLVAAWMLNFPVHRVQPQMIRARALEMRTTSSGIELNDNGSTLVLLHSRGGGQKPLIVSTPGSLRARFVDEETGQVTVNNVYSE